MEPSSSSSSGRPSSSRRDWPVRFEDLPREEILGALFIAATVEGDITKFKELTRYAERAELLQGETSVEKLVATVVTKPSAKRRGLLHMAAYYGKLDMCNFLINDLHIDVNAADADGAAPLRFAVNSRSKAVVELLLDLGADPDKADMTGFTALHSAADLGTCDIAELLLSKNASVDPICEKGTPLHIAAENGNLNMLELLLQRQANPDRVVRLFYTPLIVAILSNSLKCVQRLIEAGVDVNVGRPVTPLVLAANDDLTDFIKCLLEAGADPNVPDEIGRMPLEIAAIQGWKECVEILFPVTSPVARFADWGVDGIIDHVETYEVVLNARGDAAYEKRDYPHAAALYTKAIESGSTDSTLYIKRSVCWLSIGQKGKALEDANKYQSMEPDLSNSSCEHGADQNARIMLRAYVQHCKAVASGMNLDIESEGSDPTGEAPREKHP